MIKRNPFYSEKGITLVELVVAIGVVSIIIMALTRMFGDSIQLFSRGEEKSNNQMQMRIVTDEVTKDLRYAKKLTMLKEVDINDAMNDYISGPPYNVLDEEYKYIFFTKKDGDHVLFILEYNNDVGVNKWIPKEFLKGKLDVGVDTHPDANPGDENSYFQLNERTVKFDVTDKAKKHTDARRFKLTTDINLLNGDITGYEPVDPNPQTPPNKYRGIKYKK